MAAVIFSSSTWRARQVRLIVVGWKTAWPRRELTIFASRRTPFARVAFSVIGFLRERDGLYTVIATVVLVLLAAAVTSH